ncbi:MAG: hypothetical protein C5B48_04810 [Candidatus Rokuibacteriota bacterium]|nr:MAG: hypothetical protein C5B48_04810 [Candidatus Rokubacteria bacterium]
MPAGLGLRTGLPVGLSLDGPHGSDQRLLAIGLANERVLGRTLPPRRSQQSQLRAWAASSGKPSRIRPKSTDGKGRAVRRNARREGDRVASHKVAGSLPSGGGTWP